MDAVPNDLVVQPSRHASTHSEDEFPLEGLLEEFKHLIALGRVRQVPGSRSTGIGFAVPGAGVHVVINDDGAFGVAGTLEVLIARDGDFAVGLVAGHVAEDGGADGAFGPLFAADHLQEADFVELVRAAEHEDVVVELLEALLLDGLDDVLLETDHALLVLHVGLAEGELDGVEVGYLEDVVVLLLLELILAIDLVDEK